MIIKINMVAYFCTVQLVMEENLNVHKGMVSKDIPIGCMNGN